MPNILDKSLAAKEEVCFRIKKDEQYSTAILRSAFYMTTVHCPGKEIAVQVSNKTEPYLEDDRDWFNVGTGEFIICKPAPFKWLRVKAAPMEPGTEREEDDIVYLQSIKATY